MRLVWVLLGALILCSPVLGQSVDLSFAPTEATGLHYDGKLVFNMDLPNQGPVEVKATAAFTVSVGKAEEKGVPITIAITEASAIAAGQGLPSSYAGKECKGLWDKHGLVTEAITKLPTPTEMGPADQFVAMLVTSTEFMLPGEKTEVGGKWKGERENAPSLVTEPGDNNTKDEWEGTFVSLKDGVATVDLDLQVTGTGGGMDIKIKGKLTCEFDTKSWTLLKSKGALDGTVQTPGGEVTFKISDLTLELKKEG